MKETDAIYAMEHGGFLLRPPVAPSNKDFNHFDSTVVKPYKKCLGLKRKKVYAQTEIEIERNSRNERKMSKNFR